MAETQKWLNMEDVPYNEQIIVVDIDKNVYLGSMDFSEDRFYPDHYQYSPIPRTHLNGWFPIPQMS